MHISNIRPTKTFADFSASRYPLPVKVLESILASGNICVKGIWACITVRFQEIGTARIRISWNSLKLTLSIVLCSNFLPTAVTGPHPQHSHYCSQSRTKCTLNSIGSLKMKQQLLIRKTEPRAWILQWVTVNSRRRTEKTVRGVIFYTK